MSNFERDNFGKWCMLVLGSLMVSSGLVMLYGYLTTGVIFHRPSNRLPLDLSGSAAAVFYSLYFLVGICLLVAGVRGLRAK